ncbi:MerR family transcriptional regulator [Spirillospora sp. NPDC048911]|uniref:MerR family transcriptional regulator n=1 Tax=Spirillospora sp. NPDC048911 TaxID=3364527 RepID=UPI003724263B
MESTWTITELADRAVAALAADGSPRANGRVRDLPNERLIRWYTTIGLVDPPLGRRGRTALYGPRHLLQLVAVKRRQAAGQSIADIQAELTGATDATLNEIARLPEPIATTLPAADPLPANPSRDRFWTTRPHAAATTSPAADNGPAGAATTSPAEAAPAVAARASTEAEPTAKAAAVTDAEAAAGAGAASTEAGAVARVTAGQLVQGVRLTPDLTLLLNVPSLNEEDLAAIETAARPLLDELWRRGLIGTDPDSQSAVNSGSSS